MKIRVICLALAVIASMVVTLVAGCATPVQTPTTTVPVVKKPPYVLYYQIVNVSGAYAADTAGAIAADQDAIVYLNEQGGVDGVPWKYVYRDTGGDLKASIAAYESVISGDPKLLIWRITESAIAEALKERLKEDGVVSFVAGGSPTFLYPPGNLYTQNPSYSDQCGYVMDWLVATQPKPIKLAFLTWDSVFGRAVLNDDVREYAKLKGIEIVDEEVFGVTQVDVTTQLTRIKEKGANWVYSNVLGQGEAVILKSANQLDLLGKIGFTGCNWTMLAHTTIKLGGALSEGYTAPTQLRNWDETNIPYIKLINERAEAAKAEKTSNWLQAIGIPKMMGYVLANAVKEVGWEKVNAAALKKQIEKLDKYDIGFSYVTLTAKKHESLWTRMETIKDGKIVPIEDYKQVPNLAPKAYR